MAEIERDAKDSYFVVYDNLRAVKSEFSPQDYAGARKFAEILCRRIVKINSLTDLPELPD